MKSLLLGTDHLYAISLRYPSPMLLQWLAQSPNTTNRPVLAFSNIPFTAAVAAIRDAP